ncbi:MAG: CapA family protein [Methanomicrobia archaeon]|nr:CapA family protein [Methanomicrobia archaeon]
MNVSLMSMGDIYLKRDDPKTAFSEITPLLEKADVIFGNLETPLTNRDSAALGRLVPLKTSPSMVEGVTGIDIVSLANNHTTDYGTGGLVDTIKILDSKKIQYVGAGYNFMESHEPKIIKREDLKISFLAYECTIWSFGAEGKEKIPGAAKINVSPLLATPNIDKGDLKIMKEDVRNAKKISDVVVTSFHWGVDLSGTVAPHQKALAHDAIKSGSDVVLGHHPHRLQGIEIYEGKLICYSLGNIIFDTMFLYPQNTLIIETILSKGGLEEVYAYPVYITKSGKGLFEPTLPKENNFKNIVCEIEELSEEFGTKFLKKEKKVEIVLS